MNLMRYANGHHIKTWLYHIGQRLSNSLQYKGYILQMNGNILTLNLGLNTDNGPNICCLDSCDTLQMKYQAQLRKASKDDDNDNSILAVHPARQSRVSFDIIIRF